MNIEKPIYHLLKNEPFYAHFILGSKITFDNPQVKTAGAAVTKNGVQFFIDSGWFFTKTIDEQVAVLKHEVLHVALLHCGSRGGDKSNRMAKNVAMDCAINQYIKDLPEGCVTLSSLEEICKKRLEPFETWEYYYEQIKQNVEPSNDPHDHDAMEGSEQLTDAEKEQLKATVKDAVNKATKSAAGNVPKELASIISEMNAASQISWKQQLRNIVAKARSIKRKNTRMKINRRFDLDQPGKKKEQELIVGVCVDSSGSVSNESYALFMSEIYHLAKNTSITYLIEADCEVQKVDVIKGGKPKAGVLTKRNGSGGTAYQPAITECIKRKCDVIVYLGDMDSADTPTNPGVPFIWVRVGSSEPPGNFGRVLDLT